MNERARRFAAAIASFGAAIAAIATGAFPCPIARFAHLPCPGCGLTRATILLAHGRIDEAVHMHPLAPILAPAIAIAAIASAGFWVNTGRLPRLSRGQLRAAIAGAVLIDLAAIAIWLARAAGALGGPVSITR